MTYSFNGMN